MNVGIFYDYKQLIDEFTIQYPNYRKNICRELFWEKDLFHMDIEEMNLFLTDEVCRNSRSLKYLEDNINILSKFYDWCVRKEIIQSNPFHFYYDTNIFMLEMIGKMNVKHITGPEVEAIIDALGGANRILYEMLIRGFYEGIESATAFCKLRSGDIDRKQGRINVNGKSRRMSARFMDCVKAYDETVGEYIFTDGRVSQMYRFRDYLLKTTRPVEDEGKYQAFTGKAIERYFGRITEANELSVPLLPERLFISGFINYTRAECMAAGKDEVYFINLFRPAENRRIISNDILAYWESYGMKKTNKINRIKQRCFPCLVNSVYYPVPVIGH